MQTTNPSRWVLRDSSYRSSILATTASAPVGAVELELPEMELTSSFVRFGERRRTEGETRGSVTCRPLSTVSAFESASNFPPKRQPTRSRADFCSGVEASVELMVD